MKMDLKDRPLRILMISEDVPHPSMGGLGQHAVNLARALAKAGHQVDFMGGCQFPYDAAAQASLALPGKFFPELRRRFGAWKEHRLGFFNPLRRSVLARDFARAILHRAADYDVVHYHGHAPDVGLFIPQGVNFVQTRHDQGSDCITHVRFRQDAICTETDPRACATCIAKLPNPAQTALSTLAVRQYRARVKAAFRRHKTLFVSDMLRRNFARTAGAGPWGEVVHNFIDLERVRRAIALPQRAGDLPQDARVIAFAGKLYPPKGIGLFLAHAVPRLADGTYIVVIGDGPQEQALHAAYGDGQVRFLGWRNPEETLAFMAGADAVVVPSVWEEAYGQTTQEGLALGKPTYALARGGTPELKAYEVFPGQLRLFDSMQALAAELAGGAVPQRGGEPSTFRRGIDDALPELLEVYRADFPPPQP